MKANFFTALISLTFFLVSCGDNTAETAEKQQAANPSSEIKESSSTEGEDIFGEWELVGAALDVNDNLQLDEGERKNLTPASYKDYMKLNRDSTGLFTIAKMKGRFEFATEPNGKKFMNWYDEGNGRHRVGTFLSVTKTELLFKEPGGSGLILFKRI